MTTLDIIFDLLLALIHGDKAWAAESRAKLVAAVGREEATAIEADLLTGRDNPFAWRRPGRMLHRSPAMPPTLRLFLGLGVAVAEHDAPAMNTIGEQLAEILGGEEPVARLLFQLATELRVN